MTELTRLVAWRVHPDEIDHLGHMSTLFYAQRADQAAHVLLDKLGATPAALAAAGLKAAIVDRHTFFRREQVAQADLALSGAVAAVAPRRLDVYEEMANAASGELAATFGLGLQLQHQATRAPADLPAPVLDAARALRVEPPARSHPRTLPLDRMGQDLTVADFVRVKIAPHLRREIAADVCDPDGFYAPPPPRLVTPKGGWNQGVMDQVWDTVPGFVWPAVEMRVLTPRTPRLGDVLDTYTALLSVGHKIIHSGVWTYDARTGELVSVLHQVNVFFSFATRRTQDMPAETRARLTALVTPGLLPAGR